MLHLERMKPLVSILIPAYNGQEWLADAVRSALAQTWQRKEIIIVDDGSQDQTFAVANQFASKNVIVVRQDNQGAAAARNNAYSMSQGDYIQWLDADDLLAPDKVELQLNSVERSDAKRVLLSSAWGSFMYRPHKAKFSPTLLWGDHLPVEWLLGKMGHNFHMQTATWLVSRELSEAAGSWDIRLSVDDDGEYFCRVLLKSDEVRFVPDAKVFYRDTGLNRLSYIGQSDSKMDSLFLSMRLHIGYLRSLEDTERVRSACVNYLQTSLFYFYPERLDLVKEAEDIAGGLGGQLIPPPTSWKYLWLQKIFGWSVTKRIQMFLPWCKLFVFRLWDKALSRFNGWNLAPR